MFKKDVIDMVDINDLRDEGTLRSFLENLDHWTLIDMLEEQKEEAVEIQNFEEAAQLKKILDRLQNGFTNE